jgi:mannose-6-phosphate isomerase-like protein (cupin superfamily)
LKPEPNLNNRIANLKETTHLEKINLLEKFSLFSEHWQPKIIAELNGQAVKLAKIKGEFIWHHHENEDELFYVVKGTLTMKLPERDVVLNEGEIFVVPRGVEHKPVAEEEVWLMLFEPTETLNTGNLQDERTVKAPARI